MCNISNNTNNLMQEGQQRPTTDFASLVHFSSYSVLFLVLNNEYVIFFWSHSSQLNQHMYFLILLTFNVQLNFSLLLFTWYQFQLYFSVDSFQSSGHPTPVFLSIGRMKIRGGSFEDTVMLWWIAYLFFTRFAVIIKS